MMKQVRVLITMLLGVLVAYWVQPAALLAQGPNKAALVVRSGDQQVQTACVEFSEPQISGLDLILRSGLDVTIEAQGMGALVCRIEGTGCDAGDCWCQCKGGGDCVYWSYWHQINGNWQYGQIGSTMVQVSNGAVEGWSWGPGSISAAIAPPAMSFDDICNASPAEPTATPRAAIVVTPQPTAVPATSGPAQTATPIPATNTPTAQPTAAPANTAAPSPAPVQITVTAAPPQPTAAPTDVPAAALSPTQASESVVVAQVELPTATPRARDAADLQAAAVEVPVQEAFEPPATAMPPVRVEPDRAKLAAAPGPTVAPQVTVIGAGYAPPPPHILPEQVNITPETDGLSYLVFLILVGFLAFFLLYARLREEPE